MQSHSCFVDMTSPYLPHEAHIEVLEEQIARETCRRKELEDFSASSWGVRGIEHADKMVDWFINQFMGNLWNYHLSTRNGGFIWFYMGKSWEYEWGLPSGYD